MKRVAKLFQAVCEVVSKLRGLRLTVPFVLMGMLSGCWISAQPLVGIENATAVPFQGPFKPEKEDVVIEAHANPDGSYSLIDNNGKGFNAFYLNVRDDWYVLQVDLKELLREDAPAKAEKDGSQHEKENSERAYLYNLMRIRGRDLLFYMPDCDDLTAGIAGVHRDQPVEGIAPSCTMGSASVLQQAARDYIQRIEAGEIKDEPKTLRAIDSAPE